MPGIFGIIPETPLSDDTLAAELARMAQAMRLSPRHALFSRVARGLGLGRTGPSFLNAEPQPVTSRDGSVIGVFEGELFWGQDRIEDLELALREAGLQRATPSPS